MRTTHLFRGEDALLVPCLLYFDADSKVAMLVSLEA